MKKFFGTIIVALVLLVIGLICIAGKEKLGATSSWYPYLTELSSALIVGGILSILYKVFTEREQREELRDIFKIHTSIEHAGLDEVIADPQGYDFNDFLSRNQSVHIVMNDGRRWTGNYAVALRKRFSKSGTETNIFTIDPKAVFLRALSQKVDMSDADLAKKIHDTWAELQSEWGKSDKQGALKIYALNNFPTQSVFLGNNEAVITLYQVSKGKTNVPVLVLKDINSNKSIIEFVRVDVSRLDKEAKLVFDSNQK